MHLLVRDTRWVLILKAAALWLIILLLTTVAHAQALRPYEPPSTRSRIYQQQAPSPESPATREDIYQRFRSDVQKMSPADRAKLTDRFRQALTSARSGGREEEVVHYERLLGILESLR